MKIPMGNSAVVDIAKIRDYCLNPAHPLGKHKAYIFQSRLGLTNQHWQELRLKLLAEARDSDQAHPGKTDSFGNRYVLDFYMEGPTGSGTIRSSWIILTAEEIPRLVTCYVL